MAELTLEQRKAIAQANARLRLRRKQDEDRSWQQRLWDTNVEAAEYLSGAAGDFNSRLADTVDPTGTTREALAGADMAYPEGEDSGTYAGAAAGMVGETLPYAVGGGAALGAAAARAPIKLTTRSGFTSATGNAARQLGQGIRNAPGAYAAGEAAAAGAAGAAGEAADRMAQSENASPEARQTARTTGEIVGGLAAGVAPGMAVRSLERGATAAVKHLLPMTPEGGRLRAGAELQRQSAGAIDANAEAVRNAPEGVTPARATGDPRLLAKESRILVDDPELQRKVLAERQDAQSRLEREYQSALGKPMPRAERERSLIELTAAPGAKIEKADTDEMLGQAFDSFKTAYAPARNEAIDASDLGATLGEAVKDPSIFAGESQRAQVRGFLNDHLRDVKRTKAHADNVLTSDTLLDLRHAVRSRIRSLSNADGEDRQLRQLLQNAERGITDTLERQLPDEAREALRAADSQYRKFKITEDAVYRGGDDVLSPEAMSDAIRRNARSRGEYARGGDRELRQEVLARQDTSKVFGDPEAAARMVRDLPADQRQPVKADFAQNLWKRALDTDADGASFLSGPKLRTMLDEQAEVAKSLGFTPEETERLRNLSDQLVTVQRAAPDPSGAVIEDMPAAIMDLAARWLGARAGQRVADGFGASLVMANALSDRAVKKLNELTSGEALKLMTEATTNKQLYEELLRTPTEIRMAKGEPLPRLNSWLLSVADDAADRPADPARPTGAPPPDVPTGPTPRAAPQRPEGLLGGGAPGQRRRGLLD